MCFKGGSIQLKKNASYKASKYSEKEKIEAGVPFNVSLLCVRSWTGCRRGTVKRLGAVICNSARGEKKVDQDGFIMPRIQGGSCFPERVLSFPSVNPEGGRDRTAKATIVGKGICYI